YGYNTDYYGLEMLLSTNRIDVQDKRVVILGTGGAAKCAYKLTADFGAGERVVVSRNPQKADMKLCAIGYDKLDELDLIDVLINTTPAGMSPNVDVCTVSDSVIQKSAQVVDLIYNPMQTLLLRKAESFGIKTANGLLMLVAQAIKAQEIWTSREYSQAIYTDVFDYVRSMMKQHKDNIVLIGMPGSGKSSIGMQLASNLNMGFVDTDSLIEEDYGSIVKIFEQKGESVFRDYERKAAQIAANRSNVVISTGGGIILDERNMAELSRIGTIVFIDRPLNKLLEDIEICGRPLLSDGKSALVKLHEQRDGLYRKYADIIAVNSADINSCIANIINKLEESKHENTRN
ncbi:MAG: hypothetical protein HN948_03785, partial [Clostridia bacterium]|nr:hypothetical protein [Clostridia bacterium]